MDEGKQRKYYGREITAEEIDLIRWILGTYKSLSRKELIYTICEALEWTRAEDGMPKEWQCRNCLESLEDEGLIALPAAKVQMSRTHKVSYTEIMLPPEAITGSVPIELKMPKGQEENKRWRSYIEQYHMLGHKRENGVSLRYFIVSGDAELGCLQFGSAAWALEDRDIWIGWSRAERAKNLRLVANNTRCLILPWARTVPNLASQALGRAAREIQRDWLHRYGYAPALLETFVDSSLYKGTIYKAANWIFVGATKGRGRYDRRHEQELAQKLIFVYPLQKDFREVLLGQRPYRRMDI